MTTIQNLGNIIIKLMKEEQNLKAVYEEAEEQSYRVYEEVLVLEQTYTANREDEATGIILDKAYIEYDKINEVTHEAEQRIKAIEEALEALRKAAEAIEWLGL